MAESKTPIINIFTYGLPFKLANQMYSEYQSRLNEANFILENSKNYFSLRKHTQTVELLLALSIFHKRVISNLEGGVKFYQSVYNYSKAETISIGSYKLTGDEKNKLLAVIINYQKILKKYGLTSGLINYDETKYFLRYLLEVKNQQDGY